jgi:hypothetical protein
MSLRLVLCRLGVHQWVRCRYPDGGGAYRKCGRCGLEKDVATIVELGGM